jgi:hypothetical protein
MLQIYIWHLAIHCGEIAACIHWKTLVIAATHRQVEKQPINLSVANTLTVLALLLLLPLLLLLLCLCFLPGLLFQQLLQYFVKGL